LSDYESVEFEILGFYPHFWDHRQLFVNLPKFDQNNLFQKFKKDLVKKSLNQQKMTKDIHFRGLAGRESLWTTDKKLNFHMATVKSRKDQI
jgi:hypothetical protein